MEKCKKILRVCYCHLMQFLKNVYMPFLHSLDVVKQFLFRFVNRIKQLFLQIVELTKHIILQLAKKTKKLSVRSMELIKQFFLRFAKKIEQLFLLIVRIVKRFILQTTKFVCRNYYSVFAIILVAIISMVIIFSGFWSYYQYHNKQEGLQIESKSELRKNDSIKIEILDNQKKIQKQLDAIRIEFGTENNDSSVIQKNINIQQKIQK